MDTVGKVLKSTNLYQYGFNNPIKYIDPEGLFSINIGFEIAGGFFGFGGTANVFGAYIHDPTKPWYRGWSAYTMVTYGGGAVGSVIGGGGGLYLGISNATNKCELGGPAVYGGRAGLGYISLSGYANDNGLRGGGITLGPTLGYLFGLAGGTNTDTLWGGKF